MSSDQAHRIKDILVSALKQDPQQRAAFIQQRCAGDTELQSAVEALLHEHEENLEPTKLITEDIPPAEPSDIGRHIGPYYYYVK
jgi:hypothetical protein